MADILDSPEMQTQNSFFLFNLGVHYSISLNFTTYKGLIDNLVKLIKSKMNHKNENMATPVWKTTTSIEKEKTHKMYAELRKNVTHWRFHTHQVMQQSLNTSLLRYYCLSARVGLSIKSADVTLACQFTIINSNKGDDHLITMIFSKYSTCCLHW